MVHCNKRGGQHSSPHHLGLLADCSELATTAGNFMLRGSPYHYLTCKACSELCGICADDCEKMDKNDKKMQDCAKKCRECADACKEMAKDTQGELAKQYVHQA